jgi:Domain of unknown function (DUF3784)
MWSAIVFLGSFLIIVSFIINSKNAKYLLAGYNALSEEQRESIDINNFIKSLRVILLFIGALTLLVCSVLWWFAFEEYSIFILIVTPVVLLFFIVMIKNKYVPSPIYSNSRKVVFFTVVGLLTFVLPIYFVFSSNSDAKFTLLQNSLLIEGSYDREINYKQIKSIKLVDELPRIIEKRNGFNLGRRLKGGFLTNEGKVYLNVYLRKPPYLQIKTLREVMYINTSDSDIEDLLKRILVKLNFKSITL